MIYICSKGYVSLSTAEKNYISLAKVDFKSISSICERIRTGKIISYR